MRISQQQLLTSRPTDGGKNEQCLQEFRQIYIEKNVIGRLNPTEKNTLHLIRFLGQNCQRN